MDLGMKDFPVIFSGTVMEGKKYGRKIGFPTANLDIEVKNIENGIYAGWARLEGKKYSAAIIIDPSPSFEVHIIDFNKDIYGKKIEVELLKFIRPFQKFETEENLISQIEEDLEKIRAVLGKHDSIN